MWIAQLSAMALVKRPGDNGVLVELPKKQKPTRYSDLQAPTMKLEGHQAAVNTMKFAGNGVYLASGSFDKNIYIWEVFGECPHTMTLKGHKNSVQELHWSTDSEQIYSASADSTVMVWDTETGQRIKKVTGHESFVNSCCPARRGPPLFVSGSDDGSIRVWDLRAARQAQVIFRQTYQVTAVCFSDQVDQVFSGGLDNQIRCWDIRAGKAKVNAKQEPEPLYAMAGHTDTVTGISLSPDGSHLLSNGMDNAARIWDVRPFVAGGDRQSKVLTGHQHSFEKLLLKASWSPDGKLVGVASGDCLCYVFDTSTRAIRYRLPGHTGSVNEIAFHPTQPILGSCSSDSSIFLGEIDCKWETKALGSM